MSGPFPADTLFVRARRGEFDVVIACYHDQGLIPVKLLAFGQAVNVTLGLPIIRTSVDHGTAFDIAGRGRGGSGEHDRGSAARGQAGVRVGVKPDGTTKCNHEATNARTRFWVLFRVFVFSWLHFRTGAAQGSSGVGRTVTP